MAHAGTEIACRAVCSAVAVMVCAALCISVVAEATASTMPPTLVWNPSARRVRSARCAASAAAVAARRLAHVDGGADEPERAKRGRFPRNLITVCDGRCAVALIERDPRGCPLRARASPSLCALRLTCSSFTRVTAGRIAQPPKAAFVTRLRPGQLPSRTARQLPGRIASPEMLPRMCGLPQLNCSPPARWGRSGDEEGQHGGSSRGGPGNG